jgi:hypothetical protein
MDYVYTNFFSQFDVGKPKYYPVPRFSLFYLAYLEASKYFDMNDIKPSYRILKAAVVDDKYVMFGTNIKRTYTYSRCSLLYGANMVYKQIINGNIIPSSVEYLCMTTPMIDKIPPNIKYLTIENITYPFIIDVELEYLKINKVISSGLTTTKPIKFLVVNDCLLLHRLNGIVPYVTYIIFTRLGPYFYFFDTFSCAPKMLKCAFADIEGSCRYGRTFYPIYAFKDSNHDTFIDCIRYLFPSEE